MDATEQIRRFHEFIELHYLADLSKNLRKGDSFLVLDFGELSKFDPDLASLLLDQPEEVLKAAELAVKEFDLESTEKKVNVRVTNLPASQKLLIRDIRSKHLGKLYFMNGIVRQKSDVRPQVTSARFECPSCGNIISLLQLESKFREPSQCGCGRKGRFRLVSKELIDAQRIVLEEDPDELDGGEQPKRISIFLREDLVSPLTEKRTNPGSQIMVVGSVKEVPITGRDGGKLTRYDLLVDSNYVEGVQEDYYDIQISEEDEKIIKEIAKDPRMRERVIDAIAPSIFGYERIKEALVLQLCGGVRKVRNDGTVTRGDMHVLLVGDPGSGKSQMLKRISKVAPKARFVSGKGVSGAGLTASVVRDEFLGGWSLEAGALPLANKGLCAIDEMDKMSQDDTAAMHEAMEGQTITISKANIQATLRAETTILAAANPKFGRFDPYDIMAKQIDLPVTLINRFDLIFPIKDVPDAVIDDKMAVHILKLHKDLDAFKPDIETRSLKKYISYARRKVFPKLSEEAVEEIRKFYVEMRTAGGVDEGAARAIPISARQLEGLVRLAEANARLRLSNTVTIEDAKRAIDLLNYCLQQVGLDPETGKIDIDRIATGVSASERSAILVVKDLIAGLEAKIGKTIPIDDIMAAAAEKNIAEDKVEEALEKLKRGGDVFEPRRGFISRI